MTLSILKQPPPLILTHQPVRFQVKSDISTRPLRIEGKSSLAYTVSESMQADLDGNAEFDLSDSLQVLYFERIFSGDYPLIFVNLPQHSDFVFTEYSGLPLAVTDSATVSGFIILDGYIPKSRRKALYSEYSSLLDYIKAKNNFLTWFPADESKLVGDTQPEFVNYLQMWSTAPVSLWSMLVMHYTDGSTGTITNILPTVLNVSYGSVVYFPAGYEQLRIQTFLNTTYNMKTLDYYELHVNGLFNTGLQKQRFKVDTTYRANLRELLIRNPFGLLEKVRCTGKAEQNNKLSIEIARTDGRILPDKVSWKKEREDVVKVNTGFMSKAQIIWLSDMDFLEAYELIDGINHPIVFKEMTFPVIHDDVNQYSMDLEYEYTYNETAEEGVTS